MRTFIFLLLVSTAVLADDYADKYYSKKRLNPTEQEKAALAIGQKWQTGKKTSKPFVGENGAITFAFDGGQKQIMCAVLQICDIALEPGESTTDKPQLGDPRFKIETIVSGSGANRVQHITVKAKDVGLDTTLIVPTDRRMYHFRLRSDRTKFMPFVSFTYDEEDLSDVKWVNVKNQMVASSEKTEESTENLNFDYLIDGDDVSWKPTRVYNDGVKTYIDMPNVVSQKDAPALLLLRKEGGVFTDDETEMVNYRLQKNKYTVDSVFDKAMLVAGAGSNQQKIVITKENK